jgi:hypothetical protein
MAMLVGLAACSDSPVDPAPTMTLEAEITTSGDDDEVSGSAVVNAYSNRFEAELFLHNLALDQEYRWVVSEGTCDDSGELVGDASDYPEIEADDEGNAEIAATVNSALHSGEVYHLLILADLDEDGVTVACGDLEAV